MMPLTHLQVNLVIRAEILGIISHGYLRRSIEIMLGVAGNNYTALLQSLQVPLIWNWDIIVTNIIIFILLCYNLDIISIHLTF